MHKLVKKMFVKQPLALPGSANYVIQAKDIPKGNNAMYNSKVKVDF